MTETSETLETIDEAATETTVGGMTAIAGMDEMEAEIGIGIGEMMIEATDGGTVVVRETLTAGVAIDEVTGHETAMTVRASASLRVAMTSPKLFRLWQRQQLTLASP